MRKNGVLIISHGSRSREWVGLVDRAVFGMNVPEGVPVYSSFLEIVEGRLIQDGIRELEEQGVTDLIVVPLFISSGSTHINEIAYALGVIPEPAVETGLTPFSIRARVHFCSPIDDDPIAARILYSKIAELSQRPEEEHILLVAHGSSTPGFHRKWREGLSKLAERLRILGGFASADYAMLLPNQIPCKMKLLNKRHPDRAAIVVPLFLSDGYFTSQVIPSRLEGFDHRYNRCALLPHPLISEWMERQVAPHLNRQIRAKERNR